MQCRPAPRPSAPRRRAVRDMFELFHRRHEHAERPSRGSMVSAVRTPPSSDSAPAPPAGSSRSRRGRPVENGRPAQFRTLVERVLLHDVRIDLGRTQGSEFNGSRRPPGIARRQKQLSAPQGNVRTPSPCGSPARSSVGSAPRSPWGRKPRSKSRMMRARSSGSSILGRKDQCDRQRRFSPSGAAGLHRRG